MKIIDADKLKAHYSWWKGGTREMTMDEAKSDFDTIIDLQPTVDAEPKHGRWITVSDGYGNGVATASICECSLCKDTIWVYKNDKRKWNYCPNCGARMDEVEE